MTILHKNLLGNQLHESKGLSASSDKQYNLARTGANSWEVLIGTDSGTASTSSEVDITDLGDYSILVVTLQDMLTDTDAPVFRFSSDNGSTFYVGENHYAGFNQDGTGIMQLNRTYLSTFATATTGYYTGKYVISNFNQAVPTALYGHTARTDGSDFTTGITGQAVKGFVNVSTAWNALRLVSGSGSDIASGKIIVEGIKS